MTHRKYILSIAGFDPCAGAGLLADTKTAENTGSYLMGVITANTIQNESEFDDLYWVSFDVIIQQINVLLRKYELSAVKIGLVQNSQILSALVDFVYSKTSCPIIWDPIIKASAGFDFHATSDSGGFKKIVSKLSMITPNIQEANWLFGTDKPSLLQVQLHNTTCSVLLKGGHSLDTEAIDYLISSTDIYPIKRERLLSQGKHGSGCVLSAAIASYLAQGKNSLEACTLAKEYIREFLQSTDSLLGYHE